MHACHGSTEEAGTRGSQAQGQPGLHSRTVRTCLKKPKRAGKKRMKAKGRNREGKRRGGEGRAEEGRGGRRRWEIKQGKAIWKKMSAKRHWGKCMWE